MKTYEIFINAILAARIAFLKVPYENFQKIFNFRAEKLNNF